MTKRYNDFGTWIRRQFPYRVQKISVDAGFSCPNRDGRIGKGGCIYCDNRTFNPDYCDSRKSIQEQLETGKRFFAGKYPEMKYLAYFQAFTNTYGSFGQLKAMYEEALAVDDVVGLVIGTRPDCVDEKLLDYLEELTLPAMSRPFILIEYGIESSNDETLRFINRGHNFDCARRAVEATHRHGLLTGGHVILGLPNEQKRDVIRQAADLSSLPLDILKIHQLQIIRGTKLAEMYEKKPFHIFSVDEYIVLLTEYIQHLRPSLVLERFVSQSPTDMLIAPKWGLKNHEFTHLLNQYLQKTDACQGQFFTSVT